MSKFASKTEELADKIHGLLVDKDRKGVASQVGAWVRVYLPRYTGKGFVCLTAPQARRYLAALLEQQLFKGLPSPYHFRRKITIVGKPTPLP